MTARVLVVSNDRVGTRMAGPAIRAWQFAFELAREHDVTLSVPFAQLWASTGASPLRGCTRSMSCPMGMLMWRWTAPVVFRVDVTFHASPILSGKSKSSSGGRLRAVRFPAAVSGRVPKSGRTAVPEPENVSFTFTVARSPRSFHVYPRTFEEVNE